MTTQTIPFSQAPLLHAGAFAPEQAPTRLQRPAVATQDTEATVARPRDGEFDTAYATLLSYRLHREARAQRSVAVAQVIGAWLRSLAAMTRRAVDAYRRHSDIRATYHALSRLDASTLRDLGFHRSELMSVAAEVSGAATPTRARAMLQRRQLIERAYTHGTPLRAP